MVLVSQKEIARTVAREPGRLRRAATPTVLALLGAAAIVPVLVEAASGGPLAAALGGVAGNIGGGYLTGIVERFAHGLREAETTREPDELRDKLTADLLAGLRKNDDDARQLRAELTALLLKVDGFRTAVDAASGELQAHLISCVRELAGQHSETVRHLESISSRQRQQSRQLRDQARWMREMLDRLQLLSRRLAESPSPGSPALTVPLESATGPAMRVPPSALAPAGSRWRGGEELTIGNRAYLLQDYLLREYSCGSGTVRCRQARALQLIAPEDAGPGHVWLRQMESRFPGRAASSALTALPAEYELLNRLGRHRRLPRAVDLATSGGQTSLILAWPTARSGRPCDTLDLVLGSAPVPMDAWTMAQLLSELADMATAVARLHDQGVTHRSLEPAAIIAATNGAFVLRDLGLATHEPEPGEGPPGYQAPEQQLGHRELPGPGTDVYQLAALAYRIIAGCPPHARQPLPLASVRPEAPERVSKAVGAALLTAVTDRPHIREFGEALRLAREDLL